MQKDEVLSVFDQMVGMIKGTKKDFEVIAEVREEIARALEKCEPKEE